MTLLATFSSVTVVADDACNVELTAGVTMNEETIEFFNEKSKNSLYKIADDKVLIIDGDVIDLDEQQQALVTRYSKTIKAMVPEVRAVAIEGVDIAIEGVNLAFDKLLGEGNSVGANLSQELAIIRTEVAERFTLKHGFTLGEDGLDESELLGDEFEQRLESVVEKAVMSSIGSIMVAVGQEMMFSGGDSNAFETRMENFGASIEHEIESRAKLIEQKAQQLCLSAVKIDQLEAQLKSSVSQLSNIDVISASYDKRAAEHDDKSAM